MGKVGIMDGYANILTKHPNLLDYLTHDPDCRTIDVSTADARTQVIAAVQANNLPALYKVSMMFSHCEL